MQPYPPREWGWLWIGAGIFWPVEARLIDGAWPAGAVFVVSAIVILFGVIGEPAIKRIILEAD